MGPLNNKKEKDISESSRKHLKLAAAFEGAAVGALFGAVLAGVAPAAIPADVLFGVMALDAGAGALWGLDLVSR